MQHHFGLQNVFLFIDRFKYATKVFVFKIKGKRQTKSKFFGVCIHSRHIFLGVNIFMVLILLRTDDGGHARYGTFLFLIPWGPGDKILLMAFYLTVRLSKDFSKLEKNEIRSMYRNKPLQKADLTEQPKFL